MARSPVLAAAVVLVALCMLALAPGVTASGHHLATGRAAHDWHVGEPFRVGHLQWREGSGTIAWDSQGSGEDVAPKGEDWTFSTPPLASPVYMDVDKTIQVELLLSGTCTSLMRDPPIHFLTLHIGETFVGGIANREMLFSTDPSRTGPGGQYAPFYFEAPAGWCWRTYRIAPEVDVLPADLRLRLTIQPAAGETPRDLGTGPAAQSLLRIPYFPPEEAIYRFPELREALNQTTVPQDPGVIPTQTLALLGLGAVAVGSLRRRQIAVALLLVAMGLAGCAGQAPVDLESGSATPSNAATRIVIETDDGQRTGLTNESTGAVLGQVRDAMERAVKDAHVVLTHQEGFVRTDRWGNFGFPHVAPGTFQLRIDHPEHGTTQAEVQVLPGKVTRLTVFLGRDTVGSEEGFSPHRHPKFPESGMEVIFDQTLASFPAPTDAARATGNTYQRVFGDTLDVGWNEIHVPEPYSIYPGTRRIEVVIEWESAALDEVALYFHSNRDKYLNGTMYAARASGVPFNVATGWGMADSGHQVFSTWRDPWTLSTMKIIPSQDVSQAHGDPVAFDVRVTLYEGVVPIEPAHADHWGPATELSIIEDHSKAGISAKTWVPDHVVPPGTLWLRIVSEHASEMNQDFSRMGVKTYPPSAEPIDASLMSNDGRTREWWLPLEPHQPDPFYAKASLFEFTEATQPSDTAWVEYAQDTVYSSTAAYTGNPAPGSTLNVWAYRTPMPEEYEPRPAA